MRLIIGGLAQGKFAYAKEKYGFTNNQVYFAKNQSVEELCGQRVIYAFHFLVRKWLEMGLNPLLETEKIEAEIIITDEIGNGVIPMDSFDRLWREETGRCCCLLAKEAKTVTQIFMGLPRELK